MWRLFSVVLICINEFSGYDYNGRPVWGSSYVQTARTTTGFPMTSGAPVFNRTPGTIKAPVTTANLQNNKRFPSQIRTSRLKCKDYQEITYRRINVGGLLPHNRSRNRLRRPKCQWSSGLIIGGVKTFPGELPHMAALGYRVMDEKLHFGCGGSLISEMFVLTAAHCSNVGGFPLSIVRLGDQNLKIKERNSTEIDIEIDKFIPHESYNRYTKQHDIALVELQRAVNISMHIRPACLWQSFDIAASEALASGWGLTRHSDFNSASDDLMKVKLDILDTRECAETFDDHVINENQICAGVLTGNMDTCQGDSGGPLQIILEENICMYSIIAITSYGNYLCGAANSSSVYSRVSAYLDWIESIVWKA